MTLIFRLIIRRDIWIFHSKVFSSERSDRGNPWLSKILNFPKKLYTILPAFELKMREFFPENFAERLVILITVLRDA